MGTNFHTAWIDQPTPGYTTFSAASMNPALVALDKAITYLKNVILHFDGTLTYNKTTGELAWGSTIRIHFNREDGQAIQNTVAAGNITLADNEFAYVDLNETNDSVLTVAKASITTGAASNFIAVNRLVLGYRNTTSDEFFGVYLRQSWVAPGGGGFGDVVGPASAVANNIVTFNGTTGKLIQDSGIAIERNANLTLYPEYPGAVMAASGSDNDPGAEGMTSDSEVVSDVRHNYYEWSSDIATNLQSYDVVVQIPIPFNFTGFQTGVSVALTLDIKTEENTITNNKLDVTINRNGQAATSSLTDQKSSAAATWETIGFDETDSVLAAVAAGETLNVAIRMYSQSSKYVRIGKINLQIKLR